MQDRTAEIKRGVWLEVVTRSGETWWLDMDLFDGDFPAAHETLPYLPFTSTGWIATMADFQGYGARYSHHGTSVTAWTVFSSLKEAGSYLSRCGC